MKKIFSTVLVFTVFIAAAQNHASIPAFTAYAVPAEESTDEAESNMFTVKDGLHNWTDAAQQIQFYYHLHHTGKLQLALLLKNKTAGNLLTVAVAGKTFTINVPAGAAFKKINVGTVNIPSTGFYPVIISCKTKKGKTIADIQSLELDGEAVQDIQFNAKERRNAASVHLRYPLADSIKTIAFYNEITVPAGMDPVHSYYMACGFGRGYFGMQVISPTERRIIFSVWDAGNEAVDRNKVSDDNKVKLMAKGEDVFADGFGNEGTGGHSHWIYNWVAGTTYKFLVTAAADSATQTTSYAGYFFIPELQQWKLVACFKAPKDGNTLKNLYAFSENFVGTNGQQMRKAYFSNPWIRRDNGDWKELTQATFSYDATGKAGDRTDYGGGTENNAFYLWHGGYQPATAKYGDVFTRTATAQKPAIDFYKNADSLKETIKEQAAIKAYIAADGNSSWNENNGVHYKMLKEGSGDFVKLSDTVVVHYKGQLLNGFVFDETKDKPATFPLKRLIKGWQLGVPNCRVGGSIRLVMPASLAYSIRNMGEIPPNSVLVFDVEVVGVK